MGQGGTMKKVIQSDITTIGFARFLFEKYGGFVTVLKLIRGLL